METTQLIDSIRKIDDPDAIFLLEALSETSGFFSSNYKLVFMVKDEKYTSSEWVETDYLALQTHVNICSVKNNQTFQDGFYNLIWYKGDLREEILQSFVHLCEVYSSNEGELEFKDFFYALIDLFKLPTSQDFLNAVGLYGELKFMQLIWNKYHKDLSINWHKKGPLSKYDFSGSNKCLEVKTTTSGSSLVSIKHTQIFETSTCFLVLMECILDDQGETIEELIKSLSNLGSCFNNVSFSMNLAKELRRISVKDLTQTQFLFQVMRIYEPSTVNPFSFVPEEVENLAYSLDLEGFPCLNSEEMKLLFSAL